MRKKIIKVAIDSPAAAGAGTQAKLISKKYNLFYLDTGKIYRLIGENYLKNNNKIKIINLKKKIKSLSIKDLNRKNLLTDKIGTAASIVAKNKSIRNLVHKFQLNCAYNPPKKFNGSCLDGRDCTYKIVPDADFKFFITANIKIRANRRYKELRKIDNKVTYQEVIKSIKARDKSDYNRRFSPLKRTKNQILINSGNLSKKACFLKIKKIMDKRINN